ncbi:hypothetical protein RclHR1_00110034 [Rhizophagus clarus]|uniref:Uncharacterized protein n=1 Tax=Rhizophagus clarus TaxID=94130 RepID=A0A2Z6QHW9_9GLOM|nr:hypothetical protein RclHR1_00110034 [Rhizophagus clarus]
MSLLKSKNQAQSGESDFTLQDKEQLEQQYWEYREKAFECYQYCGSTTNDSRVLYYTGLYLWRGYMRVEEDEFDDIKAKRKSPISTMQTHSMSLPHCITKNISSCSNDRQNRITQGYVRIWQILD